MYLATSPLPDCHDIGEELSKLKATLSQQMNNGSRPPPPPPEGPLQAATDTSVAIDIDAGATTDTGDELPTITGTTPATPIPLVSSSEPSRRLSTSRIHKPSPILATSSPLHRPQESIGVQTEPAITGCEDDEEDRLVIEPEPTEVATVAAAAAVTTTMTTTEEESTKHDQPQMGKRRRKKKHPIRRRSRFNEDPHSRISTPAASEEQDIFQMDSDFEEERTTIGVTAPSSSSPSPQMTPAMPMAAAAVFMSRSVTMPADINAAREEWQRTMTPKRLSVTFPGGGAFHPYSDGDLTPPRR